MAQQISFSNNKVYSSSVLHHKEKYGVHKQNPVDQNKHE
jgi:hypothetical protein